MNVFEKLPGSGFPGKKRWDGGINRKKWAGKRDLRTLLWTLNVELRKRQNLYKRAFKI